MGEDRVNAGVGQSAGTDAGPRCIGIVGPFGSGKTSLLEAILARTGAISRQGPSARATRWATQRRKRAPTA